jgi:hypothetical protein
MLWSIDATLGNRPSSVLVIPFLVVSFDGQGLSSVLQPILPRQAGLSALPHSLHAPELDPTEQV